MSSLPNLDPAVANAAYIELRAALPWLFQDTSEDMLVRCRLALNSIDGLRPATAVEARFAVQMVAADISANNCVRQSTEPGADFTKARQCRAQATAMMRLTHRAVDKLLMLQRQRKHENSLAKAAATLCRAAEGAAAAFAVSQADLLPSAASRAVPSAAAAEPLPEAAAPPPAAATAPLPEAAPDAAPDAGGPAAPPVGAIPQAALDKAASFIRQNRQLALRIRRAGGLTWEASKGFRPQSLPRDLAMIDALVHGTGPVFDSLDGGKRDGRKAA